ncbi:MAG: Ig-like domain-containing protein [Clostridia bacterium]|nr:Ig-like domain-containing protein [Clostridia bacterium]
MDVRKIFTSLMAGVMCATMITVVNAENSAAIWNAEFDGNDDMSSWTKYTTSDAVDTKAFDFSSLVADGTITVGTKSLSYGRMGFEFADSLDVSGLSNICWETRFQFTDKVASNDNKMFMLNDNGVLVSQLDGKLYYGGEYGNEDTMTATNFEMKAGVWYTLLVTMNFTDDSYKIAIAGDNGDNYEGDFVSFSGGSDLEAIDYIKLPRQRTSGLVTVYDYVRIWDEDKNFSVNVSYGDDNKKLDLAKDVATEFDCKISFTEPVEESDLAGIEIDNDGVLELSELSSDGKIAQYHVSGLDYETEYTLVVPAIGNNPEKTVTFITEEYIPPEINVVYGIDDADLDGAVDVSKSAVFKVLFALPVSEDDTQEITIDNGAALKDIELSADGKTVTMTADGLAGYTKYTITVPELAGNAGKKVSFTTVDDISYILKLDFEGNDNTSGFVWTPNRDTTNPKDLSSKISNGTLKVDRNDMGSQQLTLSFNNPIDAASRENMYFETRVRYKMVSPSGDGLLASDLPIFNVFGTTTNYQETVYAKHGKLAYGGTNLNTTIADTDYEIKDNEWYTVRLHLNNVTKKFGVSISDDYGNVFDGISELSNEVQTSYGLSNDTIYHVIFGYTAQVNVEVDYLRIWDTDVRVSSTNIQNGDENVSNDSDFVIEFSKDINANSLEGISVNDSDGNIVPIDIVADTRKVVLCFTAGLRYDEDYTVTIPVSVTDTEGKNMNETIISFSTESKPLLIRNHGVEISGTTARAQVTAVNTTKNDKKVCIVMVVYDKDGNVIMMKNISENVSAASEKEIYAACMVENPEEATVKAYVWDGKAIAE